MASVEQEAFAALLEMLRGVSKEAIPAAEDAAAKVYLSAARAAAPVESGRLKRAIKIHDQRDKTVLAVDQGQSTRRRLFVGPEKKKGYYGFFVEKGHRTAGTKRIGRKASGNTHSQSGVSPTGNVGAHPWFEPAMRSAESSATQAAELAFNAELQQLNARK